MRSLRRRALLSGGLIAVLSVIAVSMVMFAYIDQASLTRFDRALLDHHIQLSVALSNNAADPGALETVLTDPNYGRPFSGRYWQVTAANGTIYASPSLFGSTLSGTAPAGDRLDIWTAEAPDGGRMRGMRQRITLDDGSRWDVVVAENLRVLDEERSQSRRGLAIGFAAVAGLGLVGALLQTAAVIRPLERLRDDVARRWNHADRLDTGDYPSEVVPLVTDINRLIDRNQDIVARARRQSADLAHAVKTPSSILRNELAELAAGGHDVSRAQEALNRIDAQVGRSLARMRTENIAVMSARADLTASVDVFVRLFSTIATRDGKTLEAETESGLGVRMDKRDLDEILGNLLDNAHKWCSHTIRLSARAAGSDVEIRIEDDGPGIAESERQAVLDSGRRLDMSKPGTGLGLTIVADLVSAYGGELRLEKSATLGGLSVRVRLPSRLSA